MVCSFSPRTLWSTLESQFHLHAHTDIPGQWFTFLLQITLSYLLMEIYLLLSCSEMMVAELMLGDLTQFLPNLHWANKKTIKRDKISIEHMRKQVKQKGHFKNPFNSSSCSGHWENGGKMEAKCYVKEIFSPTSSEVNTWKPQISTWKWPKVYTYKQTDKGVLGMERHQLVEASSEAPHFNPKVLTLWFPVVINQ